MDSRDLGGGHFEPYLPHTTGAILRYSSTTFALRMGAAQRTLRFLVATAFFSDASSLDHQD